MKAVTHGTERVNSYLTTLFAEGSVLNVSPLRPCAQVMETERMIYLVTEYASGGEIFGEYIYCIL